MEADYSEDTSVVHIYPFVRIPDDREPFMDFYIWDCMLYPESYARYVICEGCCMSEKDEESFFQYANDKNATVDESLFNGLCEKIISTFPQWHYLRYDSYRHSAAIEHLYFASHRSGSREILFKAGLVNFAHEVDELPRYNLVGSSPESILEIHAPMKLLRMLDQDEFLRCIRPIRKLTDISRFMRPVQE